MLSKKYLLVKFECSDELQLFFCRKNKTSCVWAYFIPGIFQYLFARYESLLKAYPKIITFYSHAKDRGMSRLSRFLNVFADNIIFHIFKFAGADETSGEYISNFSGIKSNTKSGSERPSHCICRGTSERLMLFFRNSFIVEYISGKSVLHPCEISHTQICGR